MSVRPNILLILTDQHRLSAVGAYGPTPCRTPNIDNLAAEGVRFENAYTSCPVCTPARATIMTGQLPHNHGMIQNTEDYGSPVHELPDGPHLLPRKLADAGYQLGYSGKWHLGSDNSRKMGARIVPCLPKDVGFRGQNFPGHGDGGWDYDEFRQYLNQRGLRSDYEEWPENATAFREAGAFRRMKAPVEATVPHYLATNTMDMIDRFSAERPEAPFFVWHNFWGPHEPYCPTDEYLDPYRDISLEPWDNYEWPALEIPGPHQFAITPQILHRRQRLTWDDWAMGIRYYYAFATLIDDQIGRMIAHLRQRNLLQKTVIIFTADHGEALGDHGGTYNKGWTHFEETHRIPFIVRMPDGDAKVTSELVSLLDIYPTVLELAGVPCPSASERLPRPADWPYSMQHSPDGMSLLPLLRGDDVQWRDAVVSEFHGLLDNSCIMRTMRRGRYKYGYTFLGHDELYDLEQDPAEMRNAIDDPAYRSVVADLRQRMQQWMAETQDYALGGFRALRR